MEEIDKENNKKNNKENIKKEDKRKKSNEEKNKRAVDVFIEERINEYLFLATAINSAALLHCGLTYHEIDEGQ